jgi:hypothetical protein
MTDKRKRPRDANLGKVKLWEIGAVVKMLEDWEASQKEF